MDIFYDVVITVLPQSVRQQGIKRLLLIVRRKRDAATAKHFLDKVLLKFGSIFRIIEHAVDVSITFIKTGEQKPFYRLIHDPVLGPVLNAVFLNIVSQPRL